MSFEPLVDPAPELSPAELARAARHLSLAEIGSLGQRRLKAARVLVVGAGGLGSPVLAYLAAAGVGHLTVVDDDVVAESNLQRQVLHRTEDLGRLKVDSAVDALARLNPLVEVRGVHTRLTADTAADRGQVLALVGDHDVVVDGTDNFATRFLLNDACALAGRPWVWASILRFDGQLSVFWPGRGPCYRCLVPTMPPPGSVPSCAEGGVLGMVCGVLGSLQAAEVVKLVTGVGEPLVGSVLVYDALRAGLTRLELRPDPGCRVCARNAAIDELGTLDPVDLRGVSAPVPAQVAVDAEGQGGSAQPQRAEIEVEELLEMLARRAAGGCDFVLLDVREPFEREISLIPESVLMPPASFTGEGPELDPHTPVVLYCRSGMRSARAQDFLLGKGIEAINLTGGVLAWSARIDPSQPQY